MVPESSGVQETLYNHHALFEVARANIFQGPQLDFGRTAFGQRCHCTCRLADERNGG